MDYLSRRLRLKELYWKLLTKIKEAGAEVTAFTPPDLSEAEELIFKILSSDKAFLFVDNLQDEKAMPQGAGLIMLSKASPFVKKLLLVLTSLLGQNSIRRIIPYFGGKGPANRKDLEEKQQILIRKFIEAMNNSPIGRLDAIISPVCALPAFLHNTADKVGLGGIYTALHNVTGFPTGVATISEVGHDEAIGRKRTADLAVRTASKIEANASGLPLGVQIAARPWKEQVVLALINVLHKRLQGSFSAIGEGEHLSSR